MKYTKLAAVALASVMMLSACGQSANSDNPIVMTVGDVKKSGCLSERLYSLECRTTDIFNMTLPKIRQSGTDMTDNLVRIE